MRNNVSSMFGALRVYYSLHFQVIFDITNLEYKANNAYVALKKKNSWYVTLKGKKHLIKRMSMGNHLFPYK